MPPALTAKRVSALEGDVQGQVPDECGGRDVARGGDLGDALLHALWGEGGRSQRPAQARRGWQEGWASGVQSRALPLWEPSPGRRRSSTCSRGRQIQGTGGKRGCEGVQLLGLRASLCVPSVSCR